MKKVARILAALGFAGLLFSSGCAFLEMIPLKCDKGYEYVIVGEDSCPCCGGSGVGGEPSLNGGDLVCHCCWGKGVTPVYDCVPK